MQAAQGQLWVVWARHTYKQAYLTRCSGPSSLQPPSVERSEAPQAAAHAIVRTWAPQGAGKRAPSSRRRAGIVLKSSRPEEDVFSGGRIGFTCAQKSNVTMASFVDYLKARRSARNLCVRLFPKLQIPFRQPYPECVYEWHACA